MSQRSVTAATSIAGVIGDPVAHSLSPALHNAGYAALDLDWVYLAFPVPAGEGAAAVEAMRSLGIRGLSVTMPHKEAAAEAADLRTPTVEALASANTLVRGVDGRISAHSTDGDGFVAGLRATLDLDISGLRVVVLGAGGAARSIIEACARAGAQSVAVRNRTHTRAESAAALAGPVGVVVDDLGEHDLVINTTSLGMGTGDALPCPIEAINDDAVVVDAIYHPSETRWLWECRNRGLTGVNGFPMLLHQAGLQFQLFTGNEAPLAAMGGAAPREVLP